MCGGWERRFGVVVCACERPGNPGRGEGGAMMQEVCAPEGSNFLRLEANEVWVGSSVRGALGVVDAHGLW